MLSILPRPLAAAVVLGLLLGAGPLKADQEAGNRTYVVADEWGQYYAKAIPAETYGLKGTTRVYRVLKEQDELALTLNWYSPQIYLQGFAGSNTVYLVQMGPWQRGARPQAAHLAIAFYRNEQLLKAHSTLDVAADLKEVSRSVSHYQVFSEVLGFRRPFGNQLVFEVKTISGRTLAFDTDTGRILSPSEEALKLQLYNAESKIGQLKWEWFQKHKDSRANADQQEITSQMLKAVGDLPELPPGYTYVPGAVFAPVELAPSR